MYIDSVFHTYNHLALSVDNQLNKQQKFKNFLAATH